MDVDCDVMLNGRVLITIKLNEKLPKKRRVATSSLLLSHSGNCEIYHQYGKGPHFHFA